VLSGFCGPITPPLPSIHCQLIEVCAGVIVILQRVRRVCRGFESGPTDINDDGRSYRLGGHDEGGGGGKDFGKNSESQYQI
jgi:hypothetical protein